jgi:hypothetical protein
MIAGYVMNAFVSLVARLWDSEDGPFVNAKEARFRLDSGTFVPHWTLYPFLRPPKTEMKV